MAGKVRGRPAIRPLAHRSVRQGRVLLAARTGPCPEGRSGWEASLSQSSASVRSNGRESKLALASVTQSCNTPTLKQRRKPLILLQLDRKVQLPPGSTIHLDARTGRLRAAFSRRWAAATAVP